jgi:hypothetical protein
MKSFQCHFRKKKVLEDAMHTMTRILFGIIGVLLLSLTAMNSYAEDEKEFMIKITAPCYGEKVGRKTFVRGTAYLPRGLYLWVLARRDDLAPLWWPQSEAKIDPVTHQWSAIATFGIYEDIGLIFDIAVISVDEKGHKLLKDYLLKAMRTGDWSPIELPKGSSPHQELKVKRID